METLRIGIAGAGGMGGHHARLLSAREDVRVVSLFDTDPVAMNRMEKTLGPAGQGLNHYASLESMIDAERLDAIVIATPHTRHADQVRTSLEAELHVLVEKPMATTTRDARDFIEYSERADRVLAVAYQRHGEGKFIKAREMIGDGAIGDVRLVHVIIAQDCLGIFS
ncbi:MAG: Gfo/Idh/MocA family oxidoreductase, partial [Gemmatimonadetes bacterium]|nr:Gfo/Idh/MocA family oxidoreductase [Gemmatimonadota bacterium]